MSNSLYDAPLTYEEAKQLAQHQDVSIRKSLAEREDIRPEILFYLTGDPSPDVRKAIANNQSTPARAYIDLAKDDNDEIRSGLAKKIAGLAPKLTAHEVDRVQSYAYQALEILASDQLSNVRQILADTLKDVAEAPEDLVIKLAKDTELKVCSPILQHSPVLSDDDLLDIISSGISSGALGAISSRATVSPSVSDAIVDTNDIPAITTLLCNDSAFIREGTLDLLVERSQRVEAWQGPLVNRPNLGNNAAQKLAEFVAENLLETLKSRQDLSPKTLSIVRKELNRRIEANHANGPKKGLVAPRAGSNTDLKKEYTWLFQQAPHVIAQNLNRMDRLSAQVIENALHDSDYDFVIAGLAEKAGMSEAVARRMIAMRSARGIVALCWKAGVHPETAERIQAKAAQIPADDILHTQDGQFALSDEELQWQLDFFANMAI